MKYEYARDVAQSYYSSLGRRRERGVYRGCSRGVAANVMFPSFTEVNSSLAIAPSLLFYEVIGLWVRELWYITFADHYSGFLGNQKMGERVKTYPRQKFECFLC